MTDDKNVYADEMRKILPGHYDLSVRSDINENFLDLWFKSQIKHPISLI
jgi:hypothetical protein